MGEEARPGGGGVGGECRIGDQVLHRPCLGLDVGGARWRLRPRAPAASRAAEGQVGGRGPVPAALALLAARGGAPSHRMSQPATVRGAPAVGADGATTNPGPPMGPSDTRALVEAVTQKTAPGRLATAASAGWGPPPSTRAR